MIIHLTSEVSPFYKRGGLGDVVGALPKYLNEKEENIVISFFYKGKMKSDNMEFQGSFYIDIQSIKYEIVYYYQEQENVKYYFLNLSDQLLLSNMEIGVGNSIIEDGENAYKENGSFVIYLYFAKGVLQLIKNLNFTPNYIFFHDWHVCGCFAFPTLLDSLKRINNCTTIVLIHNYEFQGEILFDDFNFLDEEISSTLMALFSRYGMASLLALGLKNADYVATVSATYADELLRGEIPHFGLCFLNSIKNKKIYALPNGIDNLIWSPRSSTFITNQYNVDTVIEVKKKAKEEMEKKIGFSHSSEPILLMLARLTEQKGIDIVVDFWGEEDKAMKDLKRILDLGVRLIICGSPGGGITGNIHKRLSKAQKLFPDKLQYIPEYTDEIAHQLLAASDAILCPSVYEPCGLVQLYAMSFGTVPVVRPVGGLKDTVLPHFDNPENSTGFYIDQYSYEGLIKAIEEVINIYNNQPEIWKQIVQRDMKQDFSWEKMLSHYYKFFEEIQERITSEPII